MPFAFSPAMFILVLFLLHNFFVISPIIDELASFAIFFGISATSSQSNQNGTLNLFDSCELHLP